MQPNERFEEQYVVNTNPSAPDQVVTKSVQEGPREVTLSPTTIFVIVFLAILAIGTVLYVVNNRNQNEEANRQAALDASRIQAEAQARAAQQAAPVQQSQPPVVIQQPAPTQAPPVIIQQPAASSGDTKSTIDDATMQELAIKRLADEGTLNTVTVTVLNGKAHLMGTVNSVDLKTKAENIVKAVRGVKSVVNDITVSTQ